MKRPLSLICLIIIVFLTISARFDSRDEYLNKYADKENQYVTICGTVDDIAYKNTNNILTLEIYLKEGIILRMKDNSHIPRIGSLIKVRGRKRLFEDSTNQGEFNIRTFYEISGIHYSLNSTQIIAEGSSYSPVRNSLYKIRSSCSQNLSAALPPDDAALMKTMLLGEKSTLSSDLKALYQRNGIAHVLAISGLHISLLGIGLYKLLKLLSLNKYFSTIFSSVFVILYGLMTGLSVSSVRAIFMFFLSMLAILLGRTYDQVTALSLAALLILSQNPLFIYHSGFIFSFGIVLGIAVLMPTLMSDYQSNNSSYFSSKTTSPILSFKLSYKLSNTSSDVLSQGMSNILSHPSSKYLSPHASYSVSDRMSDCTKKVLSTLTLTVISLPIYYWYYYQMPVYAMILNVLVIPVMAILVPAGILLILFIWLYPPAAMPFRVLIVGILKMFNILASTSDHLPGHYYTPGQPKSWQITAYIGILIIIILLKKKLSLFRKWQLVLLAVLLLTVRFRPTFTNTFIDVGQGDSILLRYSNRISFPSISPEFNILIDGGSTTKSKVGTYIIIPYLKNQGVSKLDALVMTHPDADHTNGCIELIEKGRLEGLTINRIILPDISSGSRDDNYNELIQIAMLNNIEVSFISKGELLRYKNLTLECMSPEKDFASADINEASIVLLASMDDFSGLYTGDIQGRAEKELIEELSHQDIKRLTVLKLAHHGSKNSTPKELLELVKPQLTIISSGKDNSYGHPHKETLERLSEYSPSTIVLRTDECGQITIERNKHEVLLKKYIH